MTLTTVRRSRHSVQGGVLGDDTCLYLDIPYARVLLVNVNRTGGSCERLGRRGVAAETLDVTEEERVRRGRAALSPPPTTSPSGSPLLGRPSPRRLPSRWPP